MVTPCDQKSRSRPAVVLALPPSPRTAAAADRLRRAGWTVFRATSARDARRLACLHRPDAVVLPVDGPEESGWLTCAKLRLALPRLRVVLVGERTPTAVRWARYVGAATLVPADAGANRLAAAVARSAGTVAV